MAHLDSVYGFTSAHHLKAVSGRRMTSRLEKDVVKYSYTDGEEQKQPYRHYKMPMTVRKQTAEDKARLDRLRARRAIKSPFAPF
ncbi:hypothetical protein [Streptomyces sp. WZ-12]|uniref:hypothetical protein n=1 Tax=Streptomyces sp. WZ-12 TaxID=3030210 RepID=UPI00238176AC|nr:hypothetical protein [Streptomyces sp. WZ-12]